MESPADAATSAPVWSGKDRMRMQPFNSLPHLQARPAEHHHEMDYFGTTGRRLLQDPPMDGPPGTVPEEVAITDTQSDAAMAPMSAMGEPRLA